MREILFINWKFLLKNFTFFSEELFWTSGFNWIQAAHESYIYLADDQIHHLYKTLMHYLEG